MRNYTLMVAGGVLLLFAGSVFLLQKDKATPDPVSCSNEIPADTVSITSVEIPKKDEFLPNATRIDARVLQICTWPPGRLTDAEPNKTYYSLRLQVSYAERANVAFETYAKEGNIIEAFTFDEGARNTLGKKITAIIEFPKYEGEGARWYIGSIVEAQPRLKVTH